MNLIENATSAQARPSGSGSKNVIGATKALTVCGPKSGTWSATINIYAAADKTSYDETPVAVATISNADPTASAVFLDPRQFWAAALTIDSGTVPATPDADGRVGISAYLEG